MGFEPTIRGYRIHTFQACAFDHSATAPHACLGEGVPLATKSRHRNSGLCVIDWVGGKNVLLESHWTALRGKGIPCERCLKSPFSSSKTRGKGLLCEPFHFFPERAHFCGIILCAFVAAPLFSATCIRWPAPRNRVTASRRAHSRAWSCMVVHGRACDAARPVPHTTL